MTIPSHDPPYELRQQVISLEEKNERLAQASTAVYTRIEELGTQVDSLSHPPTSFATFLKVHVDGGSVDAYVGKRKMNLAAAASLKTESLAVDQEVRLSEPLVAIEAAGYEETGMIVGIEMPVDKRRALMCIHQDEHRIMHVSGKIEPGTLRAGGTVVADVRNGIVLDVVERPGVEYLLLEEVPDVSYADIEGLGPQIQQIKDTTELPFRQPELHREHGLRSPKGALLYGLPGCGKTLIVKAVTTSLAAGIAAKEGSERARSYFLNIKGLQLLNKYVRKTERQIREIFSRACDRTAAGIPVVIFFDEMEAPSRTHGSGISSDVETTVVPQLLAEIDGVEALHNVIVVGVSNREDMIDPTILRPGRLDVKIRIERPTRKGSLDILSKYLTVDLPLRAEAAEAEESRENAARALREAAVDELFARTPKNEYVELAYSSEVREVLYVSDMVSGALFAAVVDRAEKLAVKDFLATGMWGIDIEHIRAAVREEALTGEDVATTVNPEERARVNAHGHGEHVVDIRPLFRGASDRIDGARDSAEEANGRAGEAGKEFARGEAADAVEGGGCSLREFDPARSGGLI